MVLVRWMVRARPGTAGDVAAVLGTLLAASRQVAGVVHFDITQSLDDPDVFVATEVFDDRRALDAQEALPEVEEALRYLERDAEAKMEATLYPVTNASPWGNN